jgi:hypothetical protein
MAGVTATCIYLILACVHCFASGQFRGFKSKEDSFIILEAAGRPTPQVGRYEISTTGRAFYPSNRVSVSPSFDFVTIVM